MMQGRSFANDDALADYLANVWLRGGIATAAIATAIGAPYTHAIQPNQYFVGRTFSPEEAKLAFSEPPWKGSKIVSPTYQKMLDRSGELTKRGIVFLDLTGEFNPFSEQLYFDACCHFNKRGYEILLREVGGGDRQRGPIAYRAAPPPHCSNFFRASDSARS